MLRQTLRKRGIAEVVDQMSSTPAKKSVNALIPFLYSPDEAVRSKAVSAFGVVMKRLAGEDMEAARVIMRRLMWSLNDESGGIGWGAPEAMAEAMARDEGLAQEYAPILISYIRNDGNYLEYAPLRRSALVGIVRLARERPAMLEELDTKRHLIPLLSSNDPEERSLAANALIALSQKEKFLPLETPKI
ncbi:MAG: DVU0298 family protein [Dissulfurimicrobium sp.]|uniref:DVU0298 family protein n=1 Tax=Dissulfurimicrobium sp. TaxID=2022436 RepID=UPI004049C011